MTKSIFSKSFIAALGLAALAVTVWHGGAMAESMSQKVKDKYKDDPTVVVGNVKGLDYRRTLFAPFGQKTLRLEAPQGMCFFDETEYTNRQLMRAVHEVMREKTAHNLVAIFADCLQMSKAAQPNSIIEVSDVGIVTWPIIPGEKVPPTLEEYLAQHDNTLELNFKKAMVDYLELEIDEELRTSEGGVSQGYTGKLEVSHEDIQAIGVAGITMLQGLPVVFNISHTGKKLEKNKDELYTLMDKVLIQQVALNNIR